MALAESTDLPLSGLLFSTGYRDARLFPTVGSIPHMRLWTFAQGAASLEARAYRYGRDGEAPPLSPKSRLVHLALQEEEPELASPTTVLGRQELSLLYEEERRRHGHAGQDADDGSEHGTLGRQLCRTTLSRFLDRAKNTAIVDMMFDERARASQTRNASFSQCYSCGSACLDAGSRPPPDESSHWFLDVHDGAKRKVAYVFCWQCVDVFMRQLQRAPHAGCGHLPLLSLPSCDEECQLMFCGRCRVDMGRKVGTGRLYV